MRFKRILLNEELKGKEKIPKYESSQRTKIADGKEIIFCVQQIIFYENCNKPDLLLLNKRIQVRVCCIGVYTRTPIHDTMAECS